MFFCTPLRFSLLLATSLLFFTSSLPLFAQKQASIRPLRDFGLNFNSHELKCDPSPSTRNIEGIGNRGGQGLFYGYGSSDIKRRTPDVKTFRQGNQGANMRGNDDSFPDNAWTWLNPLPSGAEGKDIHFVDNNTGFIITGAEIIRTTDGGDTWHIQKKISQPNRICFKNDIGYVVGDYGNVYKSTHKGATWNKISSIGEDNFNAVSVIHPDTVLITSDKKLHVSHDGGVSWSTKEIPMIEGQFFIPDIEHSFFSSSTTGHIACKNGLILKTNDAGQNWRVTYDAPYSPSDFVFIKFVNQNIGYASREHGDMLKTEDGGETWKDLPAPFRLFYGLHFVNEQLGYACGEYGSIYKITDGGASWEAIGFLNGLYDASNINAVFFFDENQGFAVGYGGRIMRTTDGGKNWQGYAMTNGNIRGIVFPTSQIGYAVGQYVIKTNDGGNTWFPVAIDTLNKISYYSSVYFLSADVGLVTASDYYYTWSYLTTDGGTSWKMVEGGGGTFSFINDQVGFSANNAVGKTIDGGNTWTVISNFNTREIHFITEQKGFALRYGDLYKTIDGGTSWEQVLDLYENLGDIDFVNDNVGYISGSTGLILKTDDGGETWKELRTVNGYSIAAFDFLTENIGFLVTEYGVSLFTSDGGITWTGYDAPYAIRTACLVGQNVFIGGDNGALLTRKVNVSDISLKAFRVESITATSATLSAAVATNGSTIENIKLEYGANNTYSKSIQLTPNAVDSGRNFRYEIKVDDLSPGTVYSFRLKTVIDGIVHFSNQVEFESLPELFLNALYVSSKGATWAEISTHVASNMNEITSIQLEYDTISTFETKSLVETDPPTVGAGETKWPRAVVTGLKPNTLYYGRLKATHDGKVYTSNVETFRTHKEYEINFFYPIIENNKVALNALVTSYEYDLTDLEFEYGLSTKFGSSVDADPSFVQGRWSDYANATIEVPYGDSIYYYRLKGFQNGKAFYSDYNIFRPNGKIILLPGPVQDITQTGATLHGLVGLQGNYVWLVLFEYGDGDSFEEVYVEDYRYINNYTFNISTPIGGLEAGKQYQYRIKVVMSNGTIVYSDEKSFHTDITTGVADKESEGNLRLFPNPTNDQVHLISTSSIDRVEVLDGLGKTILIPTPTKSSCNFSVGNFPTGIYYVRVVRDGRPTILKFVRK